jgi:hypothetical protein
MTRADLRELKKCMEIVCREPRHQHQLESFRRDKRPWLERALLCCSIAQSATMNLEPWSCAPCDAVGEPHPTIARQHAYMIEWHKAHAVVARLIALGLSPYVADPVGEITRAEDQLRRAQAAEMPLRLVASDGEPPSAA